MTQIRKADRTRSLLNAQVVFANKAGVVDCIIKNISSCGARLEITDTTLLPAEFTLSIPNKERHYHARIVWRMEGVVGVEFINRDEASVQKSGGDRIEELERENALLKTQVKKLKIELSLKNDDLRSPI